MSDDQWGGARAARMPWGPRRMMSPHSGMLSGETWRLIRDCGRPAENMALDAAVAWGVGEGLAPSTLRVYRWEPAAVSVGYAQRPEAAVDRDACARRGLAVVRRPTGGRAVLHDGDVTYAVAVPRRGPWAGLSVAATCRAIHEAVAAGLRRLGVPAALAGPRPAREGGRGSLCFATVSSHEVTAGGRKLVGSAQRRFHAAVLQHGSIPLTMDARRLASLAPRGSGDDAEVLARAMVSLAEALGRVPDGAEVAAALAAGFAETFGILLRGAGYHPAERHLADQLETLASHGTEGPPWPEGRVFDALTPCGASASVA